MERTDIVIALAGAVVLVVAVTASAVYGGTGIGGEEFAVSFPTSAVDLPGQSYSTQGSGEFEATFDVAELNVTAVTFTVAAAGPGGVSSPQVRIEVTTPAGDSFTADGSTIEVPVGAAPDAFTASAATADAVTLPPPSTAGTGAWKVLVQITSPTPVPVPYSAVVSGQVTHYEAVVAPNLPVTGR